ncbi:cupin domain-containing protein [Microbacterium gorillae]|uniref:cupin domain-containing protein n=1 Tax=Microbacterium gorillae TaxID=1231063 RepID=UPI0006946B27|nr:cupin domain-containing protein [Microbacterium gorillae]
MEVFLPHGATPADPTIYTGDAWYTMISYGREGSLMQSGIVHFAPGARTTWHRHRRGQTLYVLDGVALVGTRDGVAEVHAGETVECPAEEDHWHGAGPDGYMRHLAMWELSGTDEDQVDWLEPVTDADYATTPVRDPRTPTNPWG